MYLYSLFSALYSIKKIDSKKMFGTKIKAQFPIFKAHPKLVYLDNAATTQKPKLVIEGITNFYQKENANIHRGIYDLAAQTSAKYEKVRTKVADFIGATSSKSIVYTSGTTAAINLVATSFLAPRLSKGDEVLISMMEHHANLIPWQMACKASGAMLRVIPINSDGSLDMNAYKTALTPNTKMVAITHISNTLGTINPIADIIAIAHQQDIPVLIDGAQSTAHYPINVNELDADFFTFSGHKVFGPTGIGILYGKQELLEEMAPYQYGGDMIRSVSFEATTFAPIPQRFEAGTTNIAGVIGLGYAIDFLNLLDKKAIGTYLKSLGKYAQEQLSAIEDLTIIGTAAEKTGIISFVIKDIHPHDIASFLGAANIAIRAGHHCTQPLMRHLALPATSRASLSIYNTEEDIDLLVAAIKETIDFFVIS